VRATGRQNVTSRLAKPKSYARRAIAIRFVESFQRSRRRIANLPNLTSVVVRDPGDAKNFVVISVSLSMESDRFLEPPASSESFPATFLVKRRK